MNSSPRNAEELLQENAELRQRLEEAEETLRAIRAGEVDALMMGEQVYSLKGAETPYRILIEQMYEGAATLVEDGTVLYANRCLGLLLRTPLQEIVGSPLRRFVAAADLPRFDAVLAVGKQCFSKGDFNLQCPDGTTVPVQLSFGLLATPEVRAICVVAADLTERKRAEEALQQAHDSLEHRVIERTAELQRERERLTVTLASIGDALIATDPAGRVTILNPVAAALTGWPEQDALGQPIQNVFRTINEKTRAPGEDIVARVLRQNEIVKLANNTALITRDGRQVPVEDSAAPIRDSEGKVAGVVLVFRDVTEKRRVLQELRRANAELTQFNNAMVGRELRMIELKKEVDELCFKSGQPLRYNYPPRSE
jgi:PAS domain S-box-containing protein